MRTSQARDGCSKVPPPQGLHPPFECKRQSASLAFSSGCCANFAKPSSGYITVHQQPSMMRAALALALCLACVAHAADFPASAPAPAPSTPEIQGLTHVDTVGCTCRCPGLVICF